MNLYFVMKHDITNHYTGRWRAGDLPVRLLHHTILPHLPLNSNHLRLNQPEINELIAVFGIRPQGNRFDSPHPAGLQIKRPQVAE